MANTHMIGNTSYYLIKPETTFGVLNTSASANDIVLGQTVNMSLVPNIIERPTHTGAITDTTCNSVFVSSEASVTLEGAYSSDYVQLLSAYMQVPTIATGSAVTFGTGSTSFSIMHLDSENNTKCRYATGCTVKSITLSGAPKDYIKMSVEFVAKSVTD